MQYEINYATSSEFREISAEQVVVHESYESIGFYLFFETIVFISGSKRTSKPMFTLMISQW